MNLGRYGEVVETVGKVLEMDPQNEIKSLVEEAQKEMESDKVGSNDSKQKF